MTNSKILYIGPHAEHSDIGEICRGDIAGIHNDIDIVTRNIGLNNYRDPTWPYQVPDYDSKSLDGITHVVQYAYPELWERYGKYKHIGYLDITEDDISKKKYVINIQMMDEIWCSTEYGCSVIEKVCDIPVKFIPHHVDLDLYKKNHQISEISEISGTFKFICASNNERNVERIIESFLKEFDPTEPASLIIKSSFGVNELIKSIKIRLKLYEIDAYQKIVLVDDIASFAQTIGLYSYCDCCISELFFLSPKTIAQLLPIRHSIGFNKTIIGFGFDAISSQMRSAYNQKENIKNISIDYLFDGVFNKKVLEELKR